MVEHFEQIFHNSTVVRSRCLRRQQNQISRCLLKYTLLCLVTNEASFWTYSGLFHCIPHHPPQLRRPLSSLLFPNKVSRVFLQTIILFSQSYGVFIPQPVT